jgi:HAD domain in Swiss Army Knife RNA repair proteins
MIRELMAFLTKKEAVSIAAAPSGDRHAELVNGLLTRQPQEMVLMLDFDGVLHPAQSGTLLYLPMLESWLRKHGRIDVVISSNWKDRDSFSDLAALFSEDLRERVIGTTPTLQDAYREEEVLALVARYDIRSWVALDDRPEGFPTTANRLIATEYFDGISPGHLALAEQVLGL